MKTFLLFVATFCCFGVLHAINMGDGSTGVNLTLSGNLDANSISETAGNQATVTSIYNSTATWSANQIFHNRGAVLQTQYVIRTTSFCTASTSYTEWTNITTTITPLGVNSLFKITLNSGVSNDTSNSFQYIRLLRNNVVIATGNVIPNSGQQCWVDASIGLNSSNESTMKPISAVYIDAPATSSPINYKCQIIRTLNGTACFGATTSQADANRASIPTIFIVEELANY